VRLHSFSFAHNFSRCGSTLFSLAYCLVETPSLFRLLITSLGAAQLFVRMPIAWLKLQLFFTCHHSSQCSSLSSSLAYHLSRCGSVFLPAPLPSWNSIPSSLTCHYNRCSSISFSLAYHLSRCGSVLFLPAPLPSWNPIPFSLTYYPNRFGSLSSSLAYHRSRCGSLSCLLPQLQLHPLFACPLLSWDSIPFSFNNRPVGVPL
jgi:hypothetical protein